MTYVINWILQKRHGEEMYSVEIYNNLVIRGDMCEWGVKTHIISNL